MKAMNENIQVSSLAFKKLRNEWKTVVFIILKPEILLPLIVAILALYFATSNFDRIFANILNIIAAVLMAVVGGFVTDSYKDIFGNTILKKKGVSAVRNLSLVRLKVKNISNRTKVGDDNNDEIINLLSLLEKDVANSTEEWTDIIPEVSNVQEVYRLLEEREATIEIYENERNELKIELTKAKNKNINTDVLEKTINANEVGIKYLSEQLAKLRLAAASTSATLTKPYYIDQYLQEIVDIEHKIDEDLLSAPLTPATLAEYTYKKFKGLTVSLPLQERLLRDIEVSNYPKLRNIDDAVNRALPAILAYKLKAKPRMFETGTDYITKALGFVDNNFRKKHGFGNETIAAFDKYASLVKK